MSQSLVNELIELGRYNLILKWVLPMPLEKVSPIYCDTRKIIGSPKVRDIFVSALLEHVKNIEGAMDAVGAMATSAISLGAILADQFGASIFLCPFFCKILWKK